MAVTEALSRMLAGVPLQFRQTGERRFEILAAEGRVTGIVRVEASTGELAESVNGSRDRSATEDTRSLGARTAGVASRSATPLKDTEKSVSVITRQQIEDQRLSSLNDLARQAPGVTAYGAGGSNLKPSYYLRGFEITEFSVDGGAPISTGSKTGFNMAGHRQVQDMSVYDRAEILAGSNGVFGAAGSNPGGVISLERKRPRDTAHWIVEGELTSERGRRLMIDRSQPLSADGALLSRFVFTRDRGDFFYDPARYDKRIGYANLEARLSQESTVNIGFSYTEDRGTLWGQGLPRYADGSDLRLSRDICLCTDYSQFFTRERELFLNYDGQLSAAWDVRVRLRSQRQSGGFTGVEPFGFNGVNADGTSDAVVSGSTDQVRSRSQIGDVQLNGEVEVLGRKLDLNFGLESVSLDGRSGGGGASYRFEGVPVNYLNWDASGWPLDQATPSTDPTIQQLALKQTTLGVFAKVNLALTDRLSLGTGIRFDRYDYRNTTFNPIDQLEATTRETESKWSRPTLTVRYALSPTMNLYGSHATINVPQSRLLTRDGESLKPMRGNTVEMGLKRADFDDTLNSSVVLYRTQRVNEAVPDQGVPASPDGNCCSLPSSDTRETSTGVELKIDGQLTSRWQIAASLSLSRMSRVDGENSSPEPGAARSQSYQTFLPTRKAKAWTTYAMGSGSPWSPRSLGMGVQAQSRTRVESQLCPNECFESTVREGGRAVFSAMASWAPAPQWSLQLNIDNLFDRRYYDSISSASGGNWYGSPRTMKLTIQWQPPT